MLMGTLCKLQRFSDHLWLHYHIYWRKNIIVPYKVHINSFTGDEQTPSQASAFHNTKENFASRP
jgi:hypothetical protein